MILVAARPGEALSSLPAPRRPAVADLGRTVSRVNHVQAGLLFAGIPLAVVVIVFVLVFAVTKPTNRDEPRTGPKEKG